MLEYEHISKERRIMKKTIFLAVGAAALLAGCGGGGGGNNGGGGTVGTFCTAGSACKGLPMSQSPAPSSPPPAGAVGHWAGTAGGFNLGITFGDTVTNGTDVTGRATLPGQDGSSTVIGGMNGSRYLDITTVDNTSTGANNNFYFRIVGQLTLQSNGHMTGNVAVEEASITPSQMSNGFAGAVDIAPAP
jgi:hypothetical protein